MIKARQEAQRSCLELLGRQEKGRKERRNGGKPDEWVSVSVGEGIFWLWLGPLNRAHLSSHWQLFTISSRKHYVWVSQGNSETGAKPTACLTLLSKFSPSSVWVLGLDSGCQAWWQVPSPLSHLINPRPYVFWGGMSQGRMLRSNLVKRWW